MKLRLLALLASLAITTGIAQAQIGVYVTPKFSRISTPTADTGVFAFLGSGNTSQFFEGLGLGVYDDLFHTPRFDAGIDVRTDILRGNGAHLSDFLVGARLAFKPVAIPIKPYVEVMGGVVATRAAHNPRSLAKGDYNVLAGADYALNHHIDFRIVEIGYSSHPVINSTTVTTQAVPFPSARDISVSTGLVFRFR